MDLGLKTWNEPFQINLKKVGGRNAKKNDKIKAANLEKPHGKKDNIA